MKVSPRKNSAYNKTSKSSRMEDGQLDPLPTPNRRSTSSTLESMGTPQATAVAGARGSPFTVHQGEVRYEIAGGRGETRYAVTSSPVTREETNEIAAEHRPLATSLLPRPAARGEAKNESRNGALASPLLPAAARIRTKHKEKASGLESVAGGPA